MSSYSTGSLTKDQLSRLDQVRLFERKYDPVTVSILESLRRCTSTSTPFCPST